MADNNRMSDEQRQRRDETKLFPIELWSKGGDDETPLMCPLPDCAELRALAEAVPEHVVSSGWYLSKPAFGRRYLYSDNFRGMGRQWIANLPQGTRYFGPLAEFMAAMSPRTTLRLLDRVDEALRRAHAAEAELGRLRNEVNQQNEVIRLYAEKQLAPTEKPPKVPEPCRLCSHFARVGAHCGFAGRPAANVCGTDECADGC